MASDSISVVIPSYNHVNFIGQAIESVINQTLTPNEIIIIDDGSVDDSKTVIESFQKSAKKNNIRYITHYRENKGAPFTLNEGIKMTSSKWVAILNSDDYFELNRFELLLKDTKKKNAELAISGVQHVDHQGEALADHHPFRKWYVEELNKNRSSLGFRFLYHNIGITTGNLFMTKSLWEKVGGFRDYSLIHDYDFFLRCLHYTSIAMTQKNLLNYRLHGSNTINEHRNLEIIEGADMIGTLFRDILLTKEKPHADAPWSEKNKTFFSDYWKAGSFGAVKSWLGGIDLSDCFYGK